MIEPLISVIVPIYKVEAYLSKYEKKSIFAVIKNTKSTRVYSKKYKMTLFVCRYFPFMLNCIFGIYDRIRVKKLDPEQ